MQPTSPTGLASIELGGPQARLGSTRRRLYGRPLAGAVPGRPVSGVVFTAAVCALRPLTEAGLYVRFPSVEAPFSARVKFRVSDTQSDAAICPALGLVVFPLFSPLNGTSAFGQDGDRR